MAFQHVQTDHGADPPPTLSGESGVPAKHQPAGVLPAHAPHPLNSPRSLPPDLVGSASAPSPSPSATSASSPGESSSTRSAVEETSEVPPQAAAVTVKEQKKRGRVNPEQLAVLEAIFAANRSPNAVRRKEISEQLGMTERQTQIWFQNRRAKEKQAGGKKPAPKGKSVAPKPPSPIVLPSRPQPILYPSQDTELQKRIREDDPVIVIPCTQLSIGTWVRVASTSGDATQRHDLLAYISEAQQRLTWFVRYREGNIEHAVRMDIALDTIADVTLKPSSPRTSPTSPVFPALGSTSEPTARVSLLLTRTPRFLMTVLPPDGGAPVWSPCGDWTEGCQASVVLRHELAGACAPLTYLWTRLHSGTTRGARTSPLIANRTTASFLESPPGSLLPSGLPSSGLPSPPTSALSELSLEQQLRSPVLSRRGSAYDASYFPSYAPTSMYPTPRSDPPSSAALHTTPALPQLAIAIPPAPYALAPSFAPAPDPRLFADALPHAWRAEYAAAFSAPAAYGGTQPELFLPASLSRRSFSHAPPASAPPRAVQYLATPPPSHPHSGHATPGAEGFPWAQAE